MVTNFMSIVPNAIKLKNKWRAKRLRKILIADEFCKGIKLTLVN